MSLQPQLRHLEAAGLIQLAAAETELIYLFRHGLIQDAAYATLLRDQRRHWHLATAEVLESLYPAGDQAGGLAPILANHFWLGGDRPRALRYLAAAGDAAFDNYANAEAAIFYQRALKIALQPGADYDPALVQHLYGRHGRALELTSHFDAALDNYRDMETTAGQHADQTMELAALLARATIHATANLAQDLPEAVRLLERASALARDLGDTTAEANISWTLLLNTSMAGADPEQGLRHGERALELARVLGQRRLAALVLTDLWFPRANTGQWAVARVGLMEAGQIARELGDRTLLAESLLRLSMTDMIAGQYDRALAEMSEAVEVAEGLHSDDMRALTRLCAGLIYADRGVMDQAFKHSEIAIRLAQSSNNVTVLIGTRSDLGRLYAYLGDPEHGLALVRQALADGHRFPLIAPWAGANLVRVELLRGQVDAAAAALAQWPDYRDLQRTTGFVPLMWSNLALAGVELALAQGDPASAARLARELIERCHRAGVYYARPEARLRLGQAWLLLGQMDQAWRELQTAQAEAMALGAHRLLWPILAALAQIALRRDAAEAAAYWSQACQAIEYLAAHAPTPALRHSFLGQTEVQTVLMTGTGD